MPATANVTPELGPRFTFLSVPPIVRWADDTRDITGADSYYYYPDQDELADPDHPQGFLWDHFWGDPRFPGVLQRECLNQLSGAMGREMPEFAGCSFLLARDGEARYYKPVSPGSQLDLSVRVVWSRPGSGFLKTSGLVEVDGDKTATVNDIVLKAVDNTQGATV